MALEFNGVDQKVQSPNTLSFTSHSLLAWIVTEEDTSWAGIVATDDSSGKYTQMNISWNGVLKAQICDGDDYKAYDGATVINDNSLHLVGITYDAVEDVLKLYVDAQEEDLNKVTDDALSISIVEELMVATGRDEVVYLEGKVFDVRVYDRVLSDAEQKIIYSARGADNIVDGLVARWLMNEKPDGSTATVASSVIDISGNGNHGTPANSSVYREAPVRLVRPPVYIIRTPWKYLKTFTETLHLTDTVSKKIGKIFSEVITLTDTIKKKVGKVFTENITLTDTFSRVWHIYRTFRETLHLQDTFSRVWHIYRTFTEKITLTDKVKMVKTNLVNLIKKLIHLEDIED